jgi:hypothetical protein
MDGKKRMKLLLDADLCRLFIYATAMTMPASQSNKDQKGLQATVTPLTP